MWNLGQFREKKKWYFVNNQLKFESKILLHMCDTCNCDYLLHTTSHLYLISFLLNSDYLSKFYILLEKPIVTLR